MTRVAAVVLAYNGSALTLDCLDSLDEHAGGGLDVIVVDNASTDGTAEAVRSRHPRVLLERSERNLGFAGGMNVGIDLALDRGATHVLVLNNDTLVEPGAIDSLLEAAERHPRAGALNPLLTFADGAQPIWFAGARFDPRFGTPGRMSHYRRPADEAGPERAIHRFTGAAVLLTRAAIESAGSFDDSLFFLYEDVDLSLRMRALGFEVWLVPDAVVRHRVAMSQGGEHSGTSFYFGTRNLIAVGDRHAPGSWWPAGLRRLVAVAAHLARARRALPGARREVLREVLTGWRDARAGRTGPRR